MFALAPPAEVVQSAPDAIQALYGAAVADRLAGRHADAVAKLTEVLARRPGDVDARLNMGLSLLALGRLDEAEAAFSAVLTAAPDYADARNGLARVGRARMEAGTRPRWRMDVDLRRSALSAGLADWTEARVSLAGRVSEWATVSGSVERTERFGAADLYLEGRIDRRLGGGTVHVALGGAADADHRPQAALSIGAAAPLGSGLVGVVDLSRASYRSGTVSTVQPGFILSPGGGRLEVSARWINLWDEQGEHRSGYAGRLVWRATERMRVSLGHARAPETSEGVTVEVGAASAGAEADLTDRVTARVNGLVEDRGAYDRRELSIGLGWRF